MKFLLILLFLTRIRSEEECYKGVMFLEGIRSIIGADPNVPQQEIQYKPFTGSFSTIGSEYDPLLLETKYCMTDNACGHWEAYSRPDVPLLDLGCNSFCYISKASGKYVPSTIYSTNNPPESYLNCGWETCS
jgi:hypothetical protein